MRLTCYIFLGITGLLLFNCSNRTYSNLNKASKKKNEVIKLDLSGKALKTIPKSVYSFVNLEVLNLDDNEIIFIGSEIEGLKNLKALSIKGNNLEVLPEAIYSLRNLEYLAVVGNNLDLNYLKEFKKKLPVNCVFLYELNL